MSRARITLGVQSGDPESSEATQTAFLGLRKYLKTQCTASYSPTIQEFAIVLRVSGRIWNFDGEGVQHLRVNRKEAYVTADYVVPTSRWKNVPLSDIEKYFATAVLKTLEAMCDKLTKCNMVVYRDKLTVDANHAIALFLENTPNVSSTR